MRIASRISARREHAKKTFVSLFSGCGGFDLGFEAAGFRNLGAFDNDADAVRNYSQNITGPIHQLDLAEQSIDVLPLAAKADVLVAGPPCQGFSTAGKMLHDDPRNDLLPLVAEIALSSGPRVVVVENVHGAISSRMNRHWAALVSKLSLAGYKTHTINVAANDFGVPQHRKRVLLLAWHTDRTLEISQLKKESPPSLTLTLSGVSDQSNHDPKVLVPGTREYKIASHIKQGQKLSNVRGGERAVHTWDIPEAFGKTSRSERTVLELIMRLRRQNRVRPNGDADPVSKSMLESHLSFCPENQINSLITKQLIREEKDHLDLVHTFNGKYRRLSWKSLSPTVDTRFGEPSYFLHPVRHRGMSVREAARIQTFPDSFTFSGSKKAQFRLIGNAVPPKLATKIAAFVRDTLL